MLKITVPASEWFDEANETFVNVKEQTLQLEHSLVSLSKWEAKWNKPFLGKGEKTNEQVIDYVRCMTLTQNVDPNIYRALTDENINQITQYIDLPMTATWFNNSNNKKPQREIVTSEVIYYWMITLNIPFECQKWHLNRLLCLIRVCNVKNAPPQNMSKKEIYSRNRALNAARKKKLKTNG